MHLPRVASGSRLDERVIVLYYIGDMNEQSAMNVNAVKMIAVIICGVDIEAHVICVLNGVAFVMCGVDCGAVVVDGRSEH